MPFDPLLGWAVPRYDVQRRLHDMRVAAVLLLLSLCGPNLRAQAPAAPLEVPYTQFTLANGLTVILHRDTTVPIVSVYTWYHVGSANERPGRTGFAHLFEHLMFE